MATKQTEKTTTPKKNSRDGMTSAKPERSATLADLASLAELDPAPESDIDDDLQRLASAAAPSQRYAQLPADDVDDLGGWSDSTALGGNADGPDSTEVELGDRSDNAP